MRYSKQILISFILLIIIASLYRIIPGRPWGFAPQWAMAIFAGSVVKDKKFSFILPIVSMIISDVLYQILYSKGIGIIYGFYDGQLTNYILFALMTVFGFFIKNFNIRRIALASFAAPTVYFFISNFLVWLNSASGAGLGRAKTFNGLLLTFNDGLPFYAWSIAATLLFSAVLFGSYFLIRKRSLQAAENRQH